MWCKGRQLVGITDLNPTGDVDVNVVSCEIEVPANHSYNGILEYVVFLGVSKF
jgi:hypothetical protein